MYLAGLGNIVKMGLPQLACLLQGLHEQVTNDSESFAETHEDSTSWVRGGFFWNIRQIMVGRHT